MPLNQSASDAVIRAVDLVGVRGINVLAIAATYGLERPDGSCLAAGATYGFPPTAAEEDGKIVEFPRREIVGAVVPFEGHRSCTSHPSISVGVRHTGAADFGRIEAVRVRYEHAGVDYELVLPWSLTVEPKQ